MKELQGCPQYQELQNKSSSSVMMNRWVWRRGNVAKLQESKVRRAEALEANGWAFWKKADVEGE